MSAIGLPLIIAGSIVGLEANIKATVLSTQENNFIRNVRGEASMQGLAYTPEQEKQDREAYSQRMKQAFDSALY